MPCSSLDRRQGAHLIHHSASRQQDDGRWPTLDITRHAACVAVEQRPPGHTVRDGEILVDTVKRDADLQAQAAAAAAAAGAARALQDRLCTHAQ